MPRWGDTPVTFDKSDTLHSAMGKLESAGGGAPVVILAPGCRIADNVLLYRLLARASQRFGTPIAVVTSNPLWRHLAREEGLRAFGSLGSLSRARRRSALALPENAVDSLFSSLLPSLMSHGWVSLVALAMVLVLAGAGVYFFVPVMKVTVSTPVETYNREVSLRVDANTTGLDATRETIPGRTLEHRFSISDFVETTGSKNIGKERAKGEVTLINGGSNLLMVPAGTVLSTATGVKFNTVTAVSVGPFAGSVPTPAATRVPGTAVAARTPETPIATPSLAAGAVRVPVVAVEPGEKGNVPALAISKVEGDGFRDLTALNEQPITGGTEAKGRVATAEDRSRLKEMLFQKAQSQSLSELTLRIRQSESLVSHSMQLLIDREEYDKNVDEEGDRLKGTIHVVATGMAFANQDLNSLVEGQWKRSVPRGYRPLAGSLQISPPEVVDAGPRSAGMRVKVAGRVERVLEVDELTESLRGLTVQEATSKIARMERPPRAVRVEMWPEWASRAYRIEVQTIQ